MLFALENMPAAATGHTPSYVGFGRHPRHPAEVLLSSRSVPRHTHQLIALTAPSRPPPAFRFFPMLRLKTDQISTRIVCTAHSSATKRGINLDESNPEGESAS